MKVSHELTRWQSVLGVAVLLLVAAAFIYVLWAMNGPVRVVRVAGELSPNERAEVRGAVAASLSGSFLTLDLDSVMTAVVSLSWPRDVKVRRAWPRGVSVDVTKEVFVARWGVGGVLNSAGEVIATPDVGLDHLPLIECQASSGARAMEVFQGLSQVLSGRSLDIAAIRENVIGEWEAEFTNGLLVEFGSDDLLGRLERFVRVYDGVISARFDEVVRVDTRYPNGVAVDWRDADPVGKSGLARPTLAMSR